jgi:hypothetical protein
MPAPPPPLVRRFDHLDAWPDVTADDLAAFDAYIREWTAHLGVRLPLFVLACLLLWWPLDLAIAPGADPHPPLLDRSVPAGAARDHANERLVRPQPDRRGRHNARSNAALATAAVHPDEAGGSASIAAVARVTV